MANNVECRGSGLDVHQVKLTLRVELGLNRFESGPCKVVHTVCSLICVFPGIHSEAKREKTCAHANGCVSQGSPLPKNQKSINTRWVARRVVRLCGMNTIPEKGRLKKRIAHMPFAHGSLSLKTQPCGWLEAARAY